MSAANSTHHRPPRNELSTYSFFTFAILADDGKVFIHERNHNFRPVSSFICITFTLAFAERFNAHFAETVSCRSQGTFNVADLALKQPSC